jgi:hypothetical protein
VRNLILLITSWAAGLAAYSGALRGLRGDILSLDNWMVIGSITLAAWLVASVPLTLPTLRQLAFRRSSPTSGGVLAVVGAALAIVPVWLNVGVWYGWHPRHLLTAEAGLLGVHYATSGLILSLSLRWIATKRAMKRLCRRESPSHAAVGR